MIMTKITNLNILAKENLDDFLFLKFNGKETLNLEPNIKHLPGMVREVSATFVATTQSLCPGGGASKIFPCLSDPSREYSGRTQRGVDNLARRSSNCVKKTILFKTKLNSEISLTLLHEEQKVKA